MIADPCLDAQHRLRHVALDARTAGASGKVARVRGHRRADGLVTAGAQGIARARCELSVLVDVGQVRIAVTVGAGGAAAQVAGALPQAHRVVGKTARPPIRPVGRVRLLARSVLQDWLEVIEVVRAGGIAGPDDVAQRVTLRADHAAGGWVEPGRTDDRAIDGGSSAASIPILGDVRAAGAVTPLARGAEVRKRGRVGVRRRLVVVVLLADVAADAVLVPLLNRCSIVLVRPDDLHVVEPGTTLDVPAWREHDDPAVLDRGQVVLDAPAAERVLDAMLARRAGDVRFGDEVDAVGHAQLKRLAPEGDPRLREIALDAGRVRRLDHLAVAAALPLGVDVLMARCAHAGTDRSRVAGRLECGGRLGLCADSRGPDQRQAQRDDCGGKAVFAHRRLDNNADFRASEYGQLNSRILTIG